MVDIEASRRAAHRAVEAYFDSLQRETQGALSKVDGRGKSPDQSELADQIYGRTQSDLFRKLLREIARANGPVTLASILPDISRQELAGLTKAWNRADASRLISVEGRGRDERYDMTVDAREALRRRVAKDVSPSDGGTSSDDDDDDLFGLNLDLS